MAAIRQAPVGGVPVGHEQAADGGVVLDVGMQAFTIDVYDALQAASRRIFPVLHLDSTDHKNLADGAAPLSAASGSTLRRNGTFVSSISIMPRSGASVRIDHRSTQLMKQEPSRLVATQSELRLELQGGHAVRMGGEEVGGKEPGSERKMRAVHHGASNQ